MSGLAACSGDEPPRAQLLFAHGRMGFAAGTVPFASDGASPCVRSVSLNSMTLAYLARPGPPCWTALATSDTYICLSKALVSNPFLHHPNTTTTTKQPSFPLCIRDRIFDSTHSFPANVPHAPLSTPNISFEPPAFSPSKNSTLQF